jgi:hypothetical protein
MTKKCHVFQANQANSGTTRTSTITTPLLTFLLTVRQANPEGRLAQIGEKTQSQGERTR